jgi:hypothetical protein
VRYLLVICILFLQFANSFTAVAEAALPVKEVSHNKKAACLYANDLLHDQAAEVARTIQFSCIVFNARDHRANEGLLSLTRQGDPIAGDLRKCISDSTISHWTPLVRLLLFPNHYFW